MIAASLRSRRERAESREGQAAAEGEGGPGWAAVKGALGGASVEGITQPRDSRVPVISNSSDQPLGMITHIFGLCVCERLYIYTCVYDVRQPDALKP